jgi:hypothetical protein
LPWPVGLDINPEAIEVCQPRLWLSLVIDANEPMPPPNLDFHFVAGDSLVDRVGEEPLDDSLPRRGMGDAGGLMVQRTLCNEDDYLPCYH